jgi:RNA polymerase sigma-70 factor, ECF subfamily
MNTARCSNDKWTSQATFVIGCGRRLHANPLTDDRPLVKASTQRQASQQALPPVRQEETRKKKMRSRVVDESNKPNAASISLRDPGADEALVAAAKAGDKLAFESLVKLHQARLFAIALRYTRVREDAEDVVQQTFQNAFVYLSSFEGKSSFSTWLTRIAINEALMLIRKRRALREVFIDDSSSDGRTTPELEMADASPDPEAGYIQQEGAGILSAAIAQLRPTLRTTIELHELGELTGRETAHRMELSVSAVKARVFHGRRKLGEALDGYRRSSRMSGSNILADTGNANRSSQNHLTCNVRG